MASTTADRLGLLHEHVRLSLLERKRAQSLKLEPDARNTHEITRSLDTLLAGIEQLEKEQKQFEEGGDLCVPSPFPPTPPPFYLNHIFLIRRNFRADIDFRHSWVIGPLRHYENAKTS